MRAAHTDPDLVREFALRHAGIFLQQAQHAKAHVFLQLVALSGHQLRPSAQATARELPTGRLGARVSGRSKPLRIVQD